MSEGGRSREVVYAVDARDLISRVSESWVRFAEHNGAPELTREAVVGRSVWEFIAGIETRHLHALVFEHVRRTGESVRLALRCDAPDRRRDLELETRLLGKGSLELTGRVLREEPRDPVDLLDASAARAPSPLAICGWCKRVEVQRGVWLEIESARGRLGVSGGSRLPALTHVTCRDCLVLVRNALRDGRSA